MKIHCQLLGSSADAIYFRAKKLQELASWRHEVTLDGIPDLNIKEGYQLNISNAPTRWQASSFYVIGRSMRHSPHEMTMTLKALAWTTT